MKQLDARMTAPPLDKHTSTRTAQAMFNAEQRVRCYYDTLVGCQTTYIKLSQLILPLFIVSLFGHTPSPRSTHQNRKYTQLQMPSLL